MRPYLGTVAVHVYLLGAALYAAWRRPRGAGQPLVKHQPRACPACEDRPFTTLAGQPHVEEAHLASASTANMWPYTFTSVLTWVRSTAVVLFGRVCDMMPAGFAPGHSKVVFPGCFCGRPTCGLCQRQEGPGRKQELCNTSVDGAGMHAWGPSSHLPAAVLRHTPREQVALAGAIARGQAHAVQQEHKGSVGPLPEALPAEGVVGSPGPGGVERGGAGPGGEQL